MFPIFATFFLHIATTSTKLNYGPTQAVEPLVLMGNVVMGCGATRVRLGQ